MIRVLSMAAFSVLIAGCASTPPLPPLANDHPAKADATATTLPHLSDPHADRAPGAHESDPFAATVPAGPGSPDHSGHQMPSMQKPTTIPTDAHADIYTCPMHPEVTSSEPGKCPKCGMKLVKKGSN